MAVYGDAGLPVELLETRHVRDAFKAMPVKTNRNDARGIAPLMRLGWFRPMHCKSVAAQETCALPTARKLLQSKHHDVALSLHRILRGFGLKVGLTTGRSFAGRIRELVEGHPTLTVIAEALLAAHMAPIETDVTGRISKIGDATVRTVLYEAANIILTRPV